MNQENQENPNPVVLKAVKTIKVLIADDHVVCRLQATQEVNQQTQHLGIESTLIKGRFHQDTKTLLENEPDINILILGAPMFNDDNDNTVQYASTMELLQLAKSKNIITVVCNDIPKAVLAKLGINELLGDNLITGQEEANWQQAVKQAFHQFVEENIKQL